MSPQSYTTLTCMQSYSGPCGDVCHLGHYKNYWTELNWISPGTK